MAPRDRRLPRALAVLMSEQKVREYAQLSNGHLHSKSTQHVQQRFDSDGEEINDEAPQQPVASAEKAERKKPIRFRLICKPPMTQKHPCSEDPPSTGIKGSHNGGHTELPESGPET
ncbi:MAG: hypothetical protein LQ350_004867 [Teloschistes chrysophthalmus]|nr:MAG: hypothetical protein LQ350_004867 [Niorma chrysophthalma]